IERDTRAVIGPTDDPLGAAPAGDPPTLIDVVGEVNVHAKTDGELWAFTVAGGISSNDSRGGAAVDPAQGTSSPIQLGNQPTQANPAQTGIAVAAAISVNLIDNETSAFINAQEAVTADRVEVTGADETAIVAATGGLAFALGAGGGD